MKCMYKYLKKTRSKMSLVCVLITFIEEKGRERERKRERQRAIENGS